MSIRNYSLSVAAVSVLFFTGCGNSSDTNNNVSKTTIKGTAIDGYINGAKVCADLNRDNICNDNEPFTFTDEKGDFSLEGENIQNEVLLLSGGTDMGTGLVFKGQLKAPAGSKTITPITTLIETIIEDQNISEEEASKIIKDNLGIDSTIDLKNYDPIEVITKNPTNKEAKKVLLEQTRIQILVNTLSDTISGFKDETEKESKNHINSTIKFLSKQIAENKDIENESIIKDILTNSINETFKNDTENEKDIKKNKLDLVSDEIIKKSLETVSKTKKDIEESTSASVLESAYAGLSVAQEMIGKKAKEAILSGDSKDIQNINITNELNKIIVEKSNKVLDKPYDIQFTSINTPITESEQNNIQYTSNVQINKKDQSISFTTLKTTGQKDTNNEIFGLIKNYKDEPITFEDGSPYICNGTNSGVGSGLDYSSILQKNGKLYMVNQFECSIGAMYMFELNQNKTTGELSAKDNTLQFISQKDGFGGFTHCAGMVTPWQSHLGSEEYEPNARTVSNGNKYFDELNKYWGDDASKNNPYFYGWTPEVSIDENGNPEYNKHFSMGRFSHELSYVMPDKKTVYLSDDGTNVGLYMFIADKVEDLSSGTLYAAKFTQLEKYQGGKFSLSWVNLGHASNKEIKSKVAEKLSFNDIFDSVDMNSDNTCSQGYSAINTTSGAECLKVKDGMEKIASRLETRRYAAIKGATTELRKEEGITYDPIHNKLYIAISEVARGMEDNKKYGSDNITYDKAGNNDIKLPANPCGGVYALDLEKNSSDLTNKEISSEYIAKNFYSIVRGEVKDYTGSEFEGNTCNVNGLSNPDNVSYIQNSNTLIIGEDTSSHKNNLVWAYNVESGELSRILSTPIGAEATSAYWHQDVNGFSYASLVTQHPTVGSKESSIGVLGAIKNTSSKIRITNEKQSKIKVPDFSIPGLGDKEKEKPNCLETGDNLVFKTNFECTSLLPWNNHSSASNADWETSTYGGKTYAYISGYGADEASNDWLISPKFELIGDEVLTFKTATAYSGSEIILKISTDYKGEGKPEDATWTDLKATFANTEKGNYVWTESGEINLDSYAGENVYIAFQHLAIGVNGGEVANWQIDDVMIKGSGKVVIPFIAQTSIDKLDGITTLTELMLNSTISGGVAPFTYLWTLDDGNTSNKESLTHTFKTAGEYTVNLKVTDKNNAITNSSFKIDVAEPLNESVPSIIGDLRVATFNSYLNRSALGNLKKELDAGENKQIKNVAQIIQRVNADVVLLQEFDYYGNEQVETFINKYLKIAQKEDTKGVDYPYYYTSTVNTGTQADTPMDFNNDGKTGTANDAFGFGEFEGQYGMVLLSKYPINSSKIRTFQKFLWKDMPNANLPKNLDNTSYYKDEVLDIFRLSSKSHWDIPVDVNGKTIHILASHPTPPVFDDGDTDGKNDDEVNNVIDWNGKRNHDEIKLWSDYIKNNASYLYDDKGNIGGLAEDSHFVIMGDQNADANEGDAYNHAIIQLLANDKINTIIPTSKGALDDDLDGDDTASWGLRADYILPSSYGLKVNQSAVFWPRKNDIKHYLIEKTGNTENSSDHRLVWADLSFETIKKVYHENFNSTTLGKMTTYSISSDKNWSISEYKAGLFTKISGYKGNENSNDWLITPSLNLEGNEFLTFKSASNYNGPDLNILISTNYSGVGNPELATWTKLDVTLSDGKFNWVNSGEIDLSVYKGTAHIAFQYLSDDSGSKTWEIDDILIYQK